MTKFQELDRVRLTMPREFPTWTLKAGSIGTIVGIWHTANLYEVEFTEPCQCLLTLAPEHLQLA